MSIPDKRHQRYNDKMFHLEKRLQNVMEWIDGTENSEMQKLATYKAIHEVFEVLTDIASMMVKDLNANPKDDYSNIKILSDLGVINDDQKKLMNEANGLRNRLIHNYNGLDDILVIQSFNRMVDQITTLVEVFREWIQKYFKK